MVKHVVMWRLRARNENGLSLIRRLLTRLPGLIDELESLEIGENFNSSAFAYDLVLITTHKDQQALEKYKEHPEHVAVANRIKELTKERAVVDFEC